MHPPYEKEIDEANAKNLLIEKFGNLPWLFINYNI